MPGFQVAVFMFQCWAIAVLFFVASTNAAAITTTKSPAAHAPQIIKKADPGKKNIPPAAPVGKNKTPATAKINPPATIKKPEPVKAKKSEPVKITPAVKKKAPPNKTNLVSKQPVKTKARNKIVARTVRPAQERITPAEPVINANTPLRVIAPKAMIVNENTGEVILRKNSDQITPIASVTKLMTAMVLLDRNLPMDEEITITDADVDRLKYSSSRLQVGTTLNRHETLLLALMSSENRAAASLARTYPGGMPAFVTAMNRKAQSLGMNNSYFADPTGLNPENTSTAEDLVKMVRAAYRYPTIQEMTTTVSQEIGVGIRRRPTMFINTNRLVRSGALDIGVSKTGYIQEAEHCLVMRVVVAEIPTIMVFLGNAGKYTCQSDAVRVSQWLRNHLD